MITMEDIEYFNCDLPDKPPVPFVYNLGFGDKFTQTEIMHYDDKEGSNNE